jgi:hypothetical protein
VSVGVTMVRVVCTWGLGVVVMSLHCSLFVCVYICVCVYVCMYVYMYVYVCVRMYASMYTGNDWTFLSLILLYLSKNLVN